MKRSSLNAVKTFLVSMLGAWSKKLSSNFEKYYNTKIFFLKLMTPKLVFSDYINSNRLSVFFSKLKHKIDYIHARTDLCAVISFELKISVILFFVMTIVLLLLRPSMGSIMLIFSIT